MPKPFDVKKDDKPSVNVPVQSANQDEGVWKAIILIGVAIVIFSVLGVIVLRGTLASSAAYEASYVQKAGTGGTHPTYYVPSPTNFSLINVIMFLAGLVYLVKLGHKAIKNSKQDLEIGLALFGSAMLLSAVLSIFGVTSYLQNYEAEGIAVTARWGWLIMAAVFGIVGNLVLYFASRIDRQINIYDRLPNDLVAPLLMIYFSILFGFSIHDLISRSDVGLTTFQRFGALGSALLFGFLSYVLMSIQKTSSQEEHADNRIVFRALGYIYVLATFFVFVLGLNQILQNATIELPGVLKWLGESLAYGAVGGFYLYYADRITKG